MYCSNCGHQLKEGQSFCNQCGAHIRQSYQNHPPHYNQNHSNYNVQRASRSKKPTGLIILLSLIFIGFIAAMLYGAYIMNIMSKMMIRHQNLFNQVHLIQMIQK